MWKVTAHTLDRIFYRLNMAKPSLEDPVWRIVVVSAHEALGDWSVNEPRVPRAHAVALRTGGAGPLCPTLCCERGSGNTVLRDAANNGFRQLTVKDLKSLLLILLVVYEGDHPVAESDIARCIILHCVPLLSAATVASMVSARGGTQRDLDQDV